MTALQNIRTQLKAILETVSGIGKVYSYYRYKKNNFNESIKLFKVGMDYKGIMFRQISCSQPVDDNEDGEKVRKWEFTMLRQVNDEKQSGVLYEDQIELLLSTFNEFSDENENDSLNNSVKEHNNLQLDDCSEVFYGDILCHRAILTMETRE